MIGSVVGCSGCAISSVAAAVVLVIKNFVFKLTTEFSEMTLATYEEEHSLYEMESDATAVQLYC